MLILIFIIITSCITTFLLGHYIGKCHMIFKKPYLMLTAFGNNKMAPQFILSCKTDVARDPTYVQQISKGDFGVL